ncbi:MAG TPA: site-2 protease family protein [Dyella sp.]|uniref:site-2 protease family protein n=1 Tax=Dyella sp. TaxID=1869338 RepID=UPI002D16B58E|nr:site-2 protease family protein [Dyella sp.]HTV84200.1 site-2 protease family protein [Dyella sp.]
MLFHIVDALVSLYIATFLCVAVHELGHFAVARCVGVRPSALVIGSGPLLWDRVGRDGVSYQVGWVPFGGHIRLGKAESDLDAIDGTEPHDGGSNFNLSKFVAIVAAGPSANIAFAFGLMALLHHLLHVDNVAAGSVGFGTALELLTANVFLIYGVYSLVPFPEADGGLLVRSVISSVRSCPMDDVLPSAHVVRALRALNSWMSFAVDVYVTVLSLAITGLAFGA